MIEKNIYTRNQYHFTQLHNFNSNFDRYEWSFEFWQRHDMNTNTAYKGLILHLTWNLLITFVDHFNRRPSIVQYDTQYIQIQLKSVHGVFLVFSFSIFVCMCVSCVCLAYQFDTKHSIAIPSKLIYKWKTFHRYVDVTIFWKTLFCLMHYSFVSICTGFECVLYASVCFALGLR